MRLHDRANDREAETGSTTGTRARCVGAVEAVEHTVTLRPIDSGTVVIELPGYTSSRSASAL